MAVLGVSKASVRVYARNTRTNACHNHQRLPIEVAVSGVSKMYARNTRTNACHAHHRGVDMAVLGVSKASVRVSARNTHTDASHTHKGLVGMGVSGVSKAHLVSSSTSAASLASSSLASGVGCHYHECSDLPRKLSCSPLGQRFNY